MTPSIVQSKNEIWKKKPTKLLQSMWTWLNRLFHEKQHKYLQSIRNGSNGNHRAYIGGKENEWRVYVCTHCAAQSLRAKISLTYVTFTAGTILSCSCNIWLQLVIENCSYNNKICGCKFFVQITHNFSKNFARITYFSVLRMDKLSFCKI